MSYIAFTTATITKVVICLLLSTLQTATTATTTADELPSNDNLPAQPFIEILILDYNKLERLLWQRIEHRADNVLLQVYKKHEMFFDQVIDHSGSGVIARNIIPNIDALMMIAANLNSTTELGRTHLKEQILDRDSITEYAHLALKILKDASNLFDFAVKDTFWDAILTHLTSCQNNTETVQSSHQVIYDFYRDIQSGFLKSYVTAQMAYMILGYYENENYSEQVDILRSTFQQRFERVRHITKQFLKKSNKIVWKCDKKVNNVYTSYTEITNFMQGLIENEGNLNAGASCTGSCSDYRHTRHFQCQSGSLCDRSINDHDPAKCNGIIRDCQEIDDADISICETGEPNRRYNYVKYSDGRIAGNINAVCHGRLRAESWIRWFVRCSNCICFCDDTNGKKSDRYFSLREVVSNIADNKIVTGVLLTKQNGIIHLAISERTLLPFGAAETPQNTFYEPWKSTYDYFNIDDMDIHENVDYFALNYQNKSINLDMVTVPKGHCVTGVRFRITNSGHITMDVRATEFDFNAGKLKNLDDSSMWITNPNCGHTQIVLQRPLNPLKLASTTNASSQINTTPNGFIKFSPTDYWSDVSQQTVPFFDTQSVEPYNPIVLSGVGLYHKSEGNSGGFIAPKLIVYDFESVILDAENINNDDNQ